MRISEIKVHAQNRIENFPSRSDDLLCRSHASRIRILVPRSLRSMKSEESIVNALDKKVSLKIWFLRFFGTEIDRPARGEGGEDVAV